MLDTILCIDDDAITLLCKVIIKSSFSHEIITVQNGEEALQYFQTLKEVENQSRLPQLIF
jgi:CheY-like chemotaxis protein